MPAASFATLRTTTEHVKVKMDKSKLRDRMLALEEAELEHAVEKYRVFMGYARIDGSEPIEAD